MVALLKCLCAATISEDTTMHHCYSKLSPVVVRDLAQQALRQALPWKPFRQSVAVAALLHVVLLAAALRSSLSAVVKRFRFGFSHETARRALDANLPEPDALAQGLVNALHTFLPHAFRRRRWDIAIDRHDVPFYGDKHTPGVLGGPKKGGTHHAFSYATAVAVRRGQRWCLALTALTDADGAAAVAALLEQLASRGVRVRCLLLDRGYYSGHVIRLLQGRGVGFVVGVPRGGGRLGQLFERPVGWVGEYTWKTERESLPVTARMVRVNRRVRGQWRHEVYAFAGVSPEVGASRYRRARYYRALMRRRFGIETSYRQLNEGKARTSTVDRRVRLLGVGLALLLRQVWVWSQRALSPGNRWWRGRRPVGTLTLAWLLHWLARVLEEQHPGPQELPLPQTVESPFHEIPRR
jgi:hypothetical protein